MKCYNLLSLSELLKTRVCCDRSSVLGIYVCISVHVQCDKMCVCACEFNVTSETQFLAFGFIRVHQWSSCLCDDFHSPSKMHDMCE